MKNVLITGASGFLGRHLSKKLKGLGVVITELSSKNCNLVFSDSLKQFCQEKYDHIFHLAAWTQAGDFCLKYPGDQWLHNQKINTHVLDWWYQYQPQAKLICMGTSCGYAPSAALREENYLLDEPIESLQTYAMTKRMLLVGLQALHKQFGLNYLYAIPSTLYGPTYHTDERQLHFIFDLIRKFLREKHFGEQVTLWGDGNQKRELIYIDDFVDQLLLINEKLSNDLINIGSGEEHTIKEFAQVICESMNFFPLISFDTTKYVGAKSKVLEVAKLRTFLSHYNCVGLDEGIKKTLSWFEKYATK